MCEWMGCHKICLWDKELHLRCKCGLLPQQAQLMVSMLSMATVRQLTCLDALFHVGFLPVNTLLQAQHVLLLLLSIPLILAVVPCTGIKAVDWQIKGWLSSNAPRLQIC